MKAAFALFILAIGASPDAHSVVAFSSHALPKSRVQTTSLHSSRNNNNSNRNNNNRRNNNNYNGNNGNNNYNSNTMQDDYYYNDNDSMMLRDDDYYYNDNNMNAMGRSGPGPRLFGNGQYFNDSSEDFRVTSRSDRDQRRNYLRYAPSGEGGGGGDRRPRETAFGGRRTNGDSFGFNERTYGGDFDNFRQGNGFRGNRRLGGSGVREELEERREQRLQQERERRYNNQRKGGADMSRWGWQQQYDPKRGNVRNGSSDDFRRGRTYNGMRDLYTPREREMR